MEAYQLNYNIVRNQPKTFLLVKPACKLKELVQEEKATLRRDSTDDSMGTILTNCPALG